MLSIIMNHKRSSSIVFLLVVAFGVYTYQSNSLEKKDEKIEQLEDNITFNQLDHNTELEIVITQTQAGHRAELLKDILRNIDEKNTAYSDTNYTDAIFERMWFKNQVP